MKNNHFRLSKWGVQAMLAGVDTVKLGLVSRRDMKSIDSGHVLLGVQSFSLDVFTKQMMLNEKNMWAVLEYFVKLVSKQEDGHYVFLKDPMKGLIRVYRVPDEEVIESDYSDYSYSYSDEDENEKSGNEESEGSESEEYSDEN